MTEDQFYNLLHKYIEGSISKVESELLQSELDNNFERNNVFIYLTNSSVQKDQPNLIEAKFQKILATANNDVTIQKKSYKKNIFNKLSTYVAAAMILIIGYFSFQLIFSESDINDTYHIATKYGERKEFTLPDGTKVWLNAGSTIKYHLDQSQNKRIVSLDGEGFFDVAHNKQIPMIITAKELEVKVIGTSFNIRAYRDELLSEASLLTGKIELQIKSDNKIVQQTMLSPGDKIKVLSDNRDKNYSSKNQDPKNELYDIVDISKTQITLLENNNSPKETAWKENVLIMEEESLKDALPKLERWFGSKLSIQNPVLDTVKITGSFQEKTIENLIQILKLSGLSIEHKKDINNQIILY